MLTKTRLLEVLKNKVDPTHYLIACAIMYKDEETLNAFWASLGFVDLSWDLQSMKNHGLLEFEDKKVFLQNIIDLKELKVTDKFLNLFSFPGTSTRNFYSELLQAYPSKTPDGRRLRVYSTTLPKKYNKLINNDPEQHELVLECLKEEIADRTKNGKLNFMYMFSTYVNNAHWQIYLDDVKERKEKQNRGEQTEEESPRFKIFRE